MKDGKRLLCALGVAGVVAIGAFGAGSADAGPGIGTSSSFAEYEAAMEKTLVCAEEAGLAPSALGPDWTGTALSYTFAGSVDAHDECYARYAQTVDVAYQMSSAVEAKRDQVLQQVSQCLSQSGIEAESYEEMFQRTADRPQVLEGCIRRHRATPGG